LLGSGGRGERADHGHGPASAKLAVPLGHSGGGRHLRYQLRADRVSGGFAAVGQHLDLPAELRPPAGDRRPRSVRAGLSDVPLADRRLGL
jgi:hypothetical protein